MGVVLLRSGPICENAGLGSDVPDVSVIGQSGLIRMDAEDPGAENLLYPEIDEDEIIVMLTPFFKKRIEGALEPLLGRLAIDLQRRVEEERKHREAFLALEEKKVALRCRAGRPRSTHKASSTKPSRSRVRHKLRRMNT